MADISKIKLGGVEYTIKDAQARQLIEQIGSPMHFVGKATGEITEGGTMGLDGTGTYNGKTGDVTAWGTKEFIWDGTQWLELGDFGTLGALAYAATASATYQPTGTVAVDYTPAGSVEVDYTPAGAVTMGAYTPAGTITGTNVTLGNVGVASTFKGGDINVQGSGEIKGTVTSTFTGTEKDVTVTGNSAGSVSVTPSKTDVLTGVSVKTATATHDLSTTAVSANYVEASEMLEFAVGAISGTVTPSVTLQTEDEEVVTDVQASFTGGATTLTGKFKPEGSVASDFEGEDINVTATGTVTGTIENTVTQPTVTVTQGTFAGTAANLTATFKGEKAGTDIATFAGTKAGTDIATFTGESKKITVSPDAV